MEAETEVGFRDENQALRRQNASLLEQLARTEEQPGNLQKQLANDPPKPRPVVVPGRGINQRVDVPEGGSQRRQADAYDQMRAR